MNPKLIFLINHAIGSSSRNAFCKKAKISAGNLSKIMRGQQPSPSVLQKIAKASGIPGHYEQMMQAAGYTTTPLDVFGTGNEIRIYGSAAAGSPIEAFEDPQGYIRLEYHCNARKGDTFALRVVGDSMDLANIPSGSIVIVRKQKTIENGEIGAFLVNGEATVKRVYVKGPHLLLVPASSNPDHLPQLYTPEDQVSLLGKVVMALIDID